MSSRSPEYLAENLAPQLLAATTSLFALAMITVLARFYVRIFMIKIFGWDGMSKLQWFADRKPLLIAPYRRRDDDHLSGTLATTPQPLPRGPPQHQNVRFADATFRVLAHHAWDYSSKPLILDSVGTRKHSPCRTYLHSPSSCTSTRYESFYNLLYITHEFARSWSSPHTASSSCRSGSSCCVWQIGRNIGPSLLVC